VQGQAIARLERCCSCARALGRAQTVGYGSCTPETETGTCHHRSKRMWTSERPADLTTKSDSLPGLEKIKYLAN
jgi:hypothetical protein